MRPVSGVPTQCEMPPVATKAKGQVRAGLRYVRTVPDLWVPLAMMAIVGTLAFNFSVVMPLFVERTFSGDDGTFTLLFSVISVGSLVGALEATGAMREMTERLASDPELALAYQRAHESYLAARDAIEPLGTDVSAGGMPNRVKCLHVHVAHALAGGPGTNPFGDEVLERLGQWWSSGSCV